MRGVAYRNDGGEAAQDENLAKMGKDRKGPGTHQTERWGVGSEHLNGVM